MKVTDEIWQSFSDYLSANRMPTTRDALDAALADVPDPSPFGDGGMGAHLQEKMVSRIAELEGEVAALRSASLPQKVSCHWSHLRLEALSGLVSQMQSVIDDPEYGE